MIKYIFLLGRPGCGKSALFKLLQPPILDSNLADTVERHDDYPILRGRFTADDERESRGEPRLYSQASPDGGYIITNDDVWDDILKELNANILADSSDGKLIFIEFSRSANLEALSNFSREIIDHAVIVYLDASFEACWRRNVRREQEAQDTKGDNHLVSREEMEASYLHDDKEKLQYTKDYTVFIVDSEQDGVDVLQPGADQIISFLKEQNTKR